MNLLILSCGTRNLLVRYFKKEKEITKVVGTDCSPIAPALYETDAHYIVPRMTDPKYLDTILDICKKEAIHAVLPLQEDELYLIATNKARFLERDIFPIVSEPASIELCRDKFAFYNHLLANGLPAIKSCDSYEAFLTAEAEGTMQLPVFLKPNRGCGSIGAMKVENKALLMALCTYQSENFILQNFAPGKEYGADIYVDFISRKVTSIFIKEKLRMRAGETEKSVSVKNEELFALIQKTIATLQLAGPIDMDIFEIDGSFYISEINPRFGGGYPHAYNCGISFPSMIAQNLSGNENADTIGSYEEGICMLKYTDLLMTRL